MSLFRKKKSPDQGSSTSFRSDLAGTIRDFAWKLYISLSEDHSSNIFFSPFSIMTALSMAFAGAKGNTADQISQVLGLSQMKDGDIHKAMLELSQILLSLNAKYTLYLATKLYAQEGYNFRKSFLKKTAKYYKTASEVVDFVRATETARLAVNKWVADQTNDKIKSLIPPRGLTPHSRLVLVNAVYFKGSWLQEFSPNSTSTQQFHVSKSESIPVQMMYLEYTCPYFEDERLRCQVLSLPYKRFELSMVIVLPNSSRSLSELEADIKGDVLYDWSKVNRMEEVEIYLPRFKLEDSCFLNKALSKMGMSDLFDHKKADLSGITNQHELFVSNFIHKTFIEVNEQGTEAVAASSCDFSIYEAVPFYSRPTFKADHPFLFYIADRKTNSILFLGRVVRPISEK